ncbi:MAG: DUF1559 domain-containing protein [Planctomycetia bacterium]|nr:DUF1559 domain-containing protein [Planctomycetia bacterium]
MRRGFNAIEIAIMLVILAVLASLLLCASSRVRVVSEKVRCSHNLKQLGFAIHGYRDAHNHFPPGTMPNPALSPEERLSFHIAVYPFVEASPLYNQFAKKESWDSPTNVGVLAHYPGRMYQCPEWIGEQDDPPPKSGHLAFTNYIGVAGVGIDSPMLPMDAPGIGFFGSDRTVKTEDVKDGLANTLLLIETTREVGPWIRGGPSTVRGVDVDDVPLTGVDRQFGGTHYRNSWFFSKRPDGFNMMLADGSVRYTKNEISPATLFALATIAGGEELPDGW